MRRAAARLLLLVAAVGAATAARSCVPPPGLLDVDPTGCCLDQPPMIDAGSSPAFISAVLAHFAYPTSVRGLPLMLPLHSCRCLPQGRTPSSLLKLMGQKRTSLPTAPAAVLYPLCQLLGCMRGLPGTVH